jgi:hypothetical protein
MTLTAANLVGFAGPQFEEISCALGLSHKVHSLAVRLQDGPVGVVLADGGYGGLAFASPPWCKVVTT